MSPSQKCKEHSVLILESALLSVSPESLIKKKISLDNNVLSVSGSCFHLDPFRRLHLLGLGKGAAGLCREFERTAGSRIAGGVVVSRDIFHPQNQNIKSIKGDHPVPGIHSAAAGKLLVEYTGNIRKNDLVLAFVTGGASAMAVAPPSGISLKNMADLNARLVRSGAAIGEINTVRKHLSAVKGGMMAKRVRPATVISFILSDVPGSDPGTIGSGPFHGDSTTFSDALTVLKKYNIDSQCSGRVIGYLERGARGLEEETPVPDDSIFENHHTFILGGNRDALEGAASKGEELGYAPRILPGEMAGDAGTEVHKIADIIRVCAGAKRKGKPLLLFGGECTVSVKGQGKGGRVQEFLLLLLWELRHEGFPFFVAGAGTDGLDGNSGDAGGWIDHNTIDKLGNHPERIIGDALKRNDSNRFFRKLNQHIHTGPTGTNVMDVFMAFV